MKYRRGNVPNWIQQIETSMVSYWKIDEIRKPQNKFKSYKSARMGFLLFSTIARSLKTTFRGRI